jgi:hypothetical protein
MRVPYSVFKGARTGPVKAYGRSIKRATHVAGSSPSLSQITNDPVPFSLGGLWSEGGRGTQSGHGDLCGGLGYLLAIGMQDVKSPCEAGHRYRRSM